MADSDCSVVFVPHPTGKFSKRFIDMTGHVNGRLTVIGFAGRRGHSSYWYCCCECGKVKAVAANSLKTDTSRSCGCLSSELKSIRSTTHGHSKGSKATPELVSYHRAKQRCNDVNDKRYSSYGGRGIEFRFESFVEFLSCVGYKPDMTCSIERIDNNLHYEAGNIRWATPKEQANNTRRTIKITIDGVTKGLSEWLPGRSKDYYKAYNLIARRGQDAGDVIRRFL